MQAAREATEVTQRAAVDALREKAMEILMMKTAVPRYLKVFLSKMATVKAVVMREHMGHRRYFLLLPMNTSS